VQSDDLRSLPDDELQRRIESAKARIALMEAQLEDIRDEGRADSEVYARIEERRLKLEAQQQIIEREVQQRTGS
jgi:hypothetical protein